MEQLIKSERAFDIGMAIVDIAVETNFEVATTSPKLMQVANKIGAVELEKLVVVIIKQFCDSMNVANTMNAQQIIECAKEYIVTYPLNSIKDLILCLRNAKKGLYGVTYNRLDQSTIFEFLNHYENDRSLYFENKRHNMKAEQSSNQMAVLSNLPEETKLIIKQVGKGLKSTPNLQEVLHKDTLESYLADLEMALPVATPDEIDMLKMVARKKGMIEVLNKIEEFESSLFRIDDDELNAS